MLEAIIKVKNSLINSGDKSFKHSIDISYKLSDGSEILHKQIDLDFYESKESLGRKLKVKFTEIAEERHGDNYNELSKHLQKSRYNFKVTPDQDIIKHYSLGVCDYLKNRKIDINRITPEHLKDAFNQLSKSLEPSWVEWVADKNRSVYGRAQGEYAANAINHFASQYLVFNSNAAERDGIIKFQQEFLPDKMLNIQAGIYKASIAK